METVFVDGSVGEGGGQVLRTALTLSCVLGKKVEIANIRARRGQPGLKMQHLAVCRMLARLCNGELGGAALGSTRISFEPGRISCGEYGFDIGTAGSCTLFLQAALPALLHADGRSVISITGGTHVQGAPTFEYFSEVFLPAARKFGVNANATMERAGFYPKGGGKIVLEAQPCRLKGASLESRMGKGARFSIVSSGLSPHVAEREEETLRGKMGGFALSGERRPVSSSCPGNAITVWKGGIGASSLGERGKPAEKVASEACDAFLFEEGSGASVDSRLSDQLLIYAALAEGKSAYKTSKITSHTSTNAEVLRNMTGRNISIGGDGSIGVN